MDNVARMLHEALETEAPKELRMRLAIFLYAVPDIPLGSVTGGETFLRVEWVSETCRAALDFNAHGGYTFIRRGAEGAELIRFPLNDVTKVQDLIREYRKCE